MPKIKYPIFKRLHGGQKGFTMIELLVVVALLGVIAAVVVLNIGGFLGSGTLESANTELHQAATATVACMTDAHVTALDIAVPTDWNGANGVITATSGSGTVYDAGDYIHGTFQAMYTIHTSGKIIGGDPVGWGDSIEWDVTSNTWIAATE